MNIEEIVRMDQVTLFDFLKNKFENCIAIDGSFILVEGEAPVLLLAHLDTVHKETVKDICKSEDGNIIMSPQGIGGDDRCGVYALLKLYEESVVKPSLLFTCDEEIGCIGADEFSDFYCASSILDDVKYLIEIDRKGKNDCVFYELDDPIFEKFIESYGFKTKWGSISDISLIAPTMNRAAVNLSSGYYNAHTQHEYINMQELENTISKVKKMIVDSLDSNIPIFGYKGLVFDDYQDYSENGNLVDDWTVEDYYDGLLKEHDLCMADIPTQYYMEYLELLDYYSERELNEYIAEYGDKAILELYDSHFHYYTSKTQKFDYDDDDYDYIK